MASRHKTRNRNEVIRCPNCGEVIRSPTVLSVL